MAENIDLPGYYNRYDPEENYEEHLFRAGYVLQSAELNEIQSASSSRLKAIADALFKDGDIIRDARIIVDSETGEVTCESGVIYIRGQARGVPPATLTVPTEGSVAVGVYLTDTVVTELEDPSLGDPAAELRNYQEPGAARLKTEPAWGFSGDDNTGEFFPIYEIEDGQLSAKEPPPAFDSITQAIAKYDRDSSGSNYVVEGMRVTQLADLVTGEQVYSIAEGRARVNGFGIQLNTSRRVVYETEPQLRYIDSEPHTSTTAAAQRINLDRTPIDSIAQVRITAEKTETINHGTFAGAQDPLPDTSIVAIIEVTQGATTYVQGVDYQLTAGKVDWSLGGAEPAPGSSYDCTYQHIASVTPTAVDETGFTVTGAVSGTLVLTNYYVRLPRIDRLCMNENGDIVWIAGVSTDYDPIRPMVPKSLIALAQIHQTWTSTRRLVNDGVRTVPMSDIEAMNERMDQIIDLVAQQKLVSDLGTREASAKKGLFVDPFLDDTHRDQGITQDAASFDGILTLPVDGPVVIPASDVTAPTLCTHTLVPVLAQESRTGSMKINPYMAFGILPSQVVLTPPVDRWTEVQSSWASPVTRVFTTGFGSVPAGISRSSSVSLINSSSSVIENLRQIEVKFNIKGFGPGEVLETVTFDGLEVEPDNI
jgi:hypothetical protein